MSNYGSPSVGYFLIGGRNVLGTRTTITVKAEAPTRETTVLGDTWATHGWPGIKRGSLSQDGFFDDATGAINAALCDLENTSQVMLLAHEGNVAGKKAWGFAGTFAATYDRGVDVGEFHKATATHTVSGAVEGPRILAALAARTTAGDTEASSIDNAALTSNGGAGYLGVTGITLGGYDNLIVKVRHSADNVTFADLLTFTAATAIGAERKTVAALTTVNRYLAISWAWTGAGAGQSATFTVAFARA
jgi:hypothetical protein